MAKKKGNKNNAKKTKTKNKNKKHNNGDISVLDTSNETKPIKVKKYYTWKNLEKIPYSRHQELIAVFLERAERATQQYGFTPYPCIPMKIKGVKRPVPLYYNFQLNQFDITNKYTYSAAVSQRRQHHDKISHLDGYKQYIRDINGQFGGMPNKYDPEVHPARLKEIAKKVDFKDHWAKHLGIDINTLKTWAKAYPEFGKVYNKYKGKQIKKIEKSIIQDSINGYDKEWIDDKTGRKKAGCSPQEKAKILALIKKASRWDDSHSKVDVDAKIAEYRPVHNTHAGNAQDTEKHIVSDMTTLGKKLGRIKDD